MNTRTILPAVLAALAGGCGGSSNPGFDASTPDLASSADLAAAAPDLATAPAEDLAGPAADLAGTARDLAAPDLRVTGDLLPPGASGQIALARAAADAPPDGGVVNQPIGGVLVTYVKPAVGPEGAGFFVQADKEGPALYVDIDPAKLVPPPVVGDKVSFTVTAAGKPSGVRAATALVGFARASQGNAVMPLLQDLSGAADLVANVDAYENELARVDGTIAAPFASSGTGHVAANLDTAGVKGSTSLRLRVPETLRDALDLAPMCQVTLVGTPIWRFAGQTQPSAWTMADVTVKSCPAPQVAGAVALSATTVVVTFDRAIDPASLKGDGSQFTIAPALAVSAANLAGRKVTLTTAQQSGGAKYTVTVAATVKDKRGSGVDAMRASAMFSGYSTPAVLLLNEVNANITGSADLIELLALSPGTIEKITVEQDVANPVVLATLPALEVKAGDLIVVHLNPPMGVTTEAAAKGECGSAECYAGAWDVAGGATGITFSHRVLALRAVDGKYMDAVPFARAGMGGTPPGGFPGDLTTIQMQGLWKPANCGGAPCTYMSNPTAVAVAVDWSTNGTKASGPSVQRKLGQNTRGNADWAAPVMPSWGAANP